MPRNGSGTYTAPSNSFNPAVAGTPIDPAAWTEERDDYADALTDSLSRSGDGGMLADLELDAHAILASEIATPSNPAANALKIYAKDVTGVTKLATLDSSGTETVFSNITIPVSPANGGTGVSNGANNTITFTGNFTLGITLSGNTALTFPTSGTLLSTAAAVTPAQGGTGITSYAVGDLLYASGATTLSKLADVAAGSYLRSGGVTTAPVWSTTTLPNSATTGDILQASASNVYSNLASVATGNALISGGVGTANSWGKIGLTTHVSGVLPVANGGTNASSASITAFNNITGYTASGATGTTSTNLVFSTSPNITTPTITTSATVPLLIGGTGVSSDLIFQTTSGVGDGTDIFQWKLGNNGATIVGDHRLSGLTVGGGASSPYAWATTSFDYIQLGVNMGFFADRSGSSNAATSIFNNIYNDGSNTKYMVTAPGSLTAMGGGVFAVFTSPSGTAGTNATITQQFIVANGGQTSISPGGNNSIVCPVTASAVNYFQVDHKATTVSPTISAVGTATNLNFETISKGTGVLINLGSYTNTAALSGAMTINTSGLIQRQTSSKEFKRNIEDVDYSYVEPFIDGLRPVFYKDNGDKTNVEKGREDWSYYGLLSEEVAELDPRYAAWGPKQTGKFDENGQHIMTKDIYPTGVHYDRIVVAIVAYSRNKFSKYEEIIGSLNSRLEKLEGTIQ